MFYLILKKTPYANENRVLLMGNTVKMAGGWHVSSKMLTFMERLLPQKRYCSSNIENLKIIELWKTP